MYVVLSVKARASRICVVLSVKAHSRGIKDKTELSRRQGSELGRAWDLERHHEHIGIQTQDAVAIKFPKGSWPSLLLSVYQYPWCQAQPSPRALALSSFNLVIQMCGIITHASVHAGMGGESCKVQGDRGGYSWPHSLKGPHTGGPTAIIHWRL